MSPSVRGRIAPLKKKKKRPGVGHCLSSVKWSQTFLKVRCTFWIQKWDKNATTDLTEELDDLRVLEMLWRQEGCSLSGPGRLWTWLQQKYEIKREHNRRRQCPTTLSIKPCTHLFLSVW